MTTPAAAVQETTSTADSVAASGDPVQPRPPNSRVLDCACGTGQLAVGLAARAVQLTACVSSGEQTQPLNAEARVSRIVRGISGLPDGSLTLDALAEQAALSPFHFLRTFKQVTGVTPHQYVRRSRLREAATRLLTGRAKVLDIALECRFDDVSSFNRAFRAEFGVSPRLFRSASR